MEEVGSTLVAEYKAEYKMEFEFYVDKDDEEDSKEKGKKSIKKKEIEKKEVNVSIAKNSHCLAELVMEARVLGKERVWSRVVIDGGQGSIKVCASIFDRDTDPDVLFGGPGGPR